MEGQAIRIEIRKFVNGPLQWKRQEEWSLESRGRLKIHTIHRIPGRKSIEGTLTYRREE